MYIIGVSACPTGIAHTYMAADAIEHAAKAIGAEYKVETQGNIGIENRLTAEDIKRADLIVFTVAIALRDKDRFEGYEDKIFNVSLTDVITNGDEIIKKEMIKRGFIK